MEIGKDRSADLKRVFRINKTIMQMMADRGIVSWLKTAHLTFILGYFVFADYRDMKFEDFELKFPDAATARSQLSIPYLKKAEQDEQKLSVFFAETANKFTKEELKTKLHVMKTTGSTMGLVILQGDSSVVCIVFKNR